MRKSRTLAKIRAGETARMCILGHYIPSFIKQAAHAGYDCVWLDNEHRQLEDHQIQSLLAFGHLFDIDVMIRTRTFEKTRLYRLLEDGATGLMIPHVSTPEKARMLVDAVKFPPLGDRGLDGSGLDAEFGFQADPLSFPEEANRETFLVVMIETPQGVENVDAIAAVEGVDMVFLGPGDLGLRLRHQQTEWSLEDAFERTSAACRKHGKAFACPVSSKEDIPKRKAQGAQLIAHGADFLGLRKMLEDSAKDFD